MTNSTNKYSPRNVGDWVALVKPGVTRMCLITTAGGMLLAPQPLGLSDFWTVVATLLGTALVVGGANAFNMWWERDTDALMARTKNRPLPSGRMQPQTVFLFALTCLVGGTVMLGFGTNWLTAIIAALAAGFYVLIYTPLKYKTPMALLIGAVPGAVPPLLGWTAVMGTVDPPALVLFAILLVWQIPHFIAISLYRKDEYARAGICCVPVKRGDAIAKIQAVAWATVLVPISLLLATFGLTGMLYVAAAMFLGVGFAAWGFTGLRDTAGPRWARGFFLASLVYLPALTLALVIDVMAQVP